jgi:RNA polymerase sigma factor (sigma-70 family)
VEAHRGELLRYARRQLGARAELAEDVLQDAFLNAYRQLAAGTRPENARAWLYAIVHNTTINATRTPGRAVALEARHSAAGGPTPAEALEQREWLDWLMGAIGTLPARQRAALVGHALEGRSYRELASRERTSISAIKTLIHRARRGLSEGSPRHVLTAPLLLLARRLSAGTARRALAGKLSANGVAGTLATVLGTATLTSGLLLAVQAGPVRAGLASHREPASIHGAPDRPHRGGSHGSVAPAVRLHHEAKLATVECEKDHRLGRHLRGAALQYAAGHLTTSLLEYTECQRVLQTRAMQIFAAHWRPHSEPRHHPQQPRHATSRPAHRSAKRRAAPVSS